MTALAFAAPSGCDSDDRGGGAESGGACIETVVVLTAHDEPTALGFSVDDVLARATGTFVAPLHWVAAEYATAGPETGEGELELTVGHQGGEARLILSSAPEPREGHFPVDEDDCRSRIEVDVEVTAVTAGGALRESIGGTLTSADGERVDLVAPIDPSSIGGSLAVTPFREDFAVQSITITGGFAQGLTWGALDVVTGYVEDDGGAYFPATVARWPGTTACEPFHEGIVVPLDARHGAFSADDVVARLGEVDGTLSWNDGGSTSLTLRLETVGGSACATELGPRGLGPALLYDAQLHLRTDDGRVDASLDVVVETVLGDDGRLESWLGARHATDSGDYLGPVPGDTFEDTFGIRGLDLAGFDGVIVTVEATIVDATTTGSFDVRAEYRSVGGASWSVP